MSQNKTEEAQLAEVFQMTSDPNSTATRPSLTSTGAILLAATGTAFAAIMGITAPFLLPGLRKICLPFVPASTEQVRNVMALLREVPEIAGGKILDIGSGDGRLVIEAAKLGFRADGVELNPWLVAYSRYQAVKKGVSGSTRFYRRNLWKHDLSQYNGIIVFGVDTMMEPLRQKVLREMRDKERSVVVACRFPMIGCPVTAEVGEGLEAVWMYRLSDLQKQTVQDDPKVIRHKQ